MRKLITLTGFIIFMFGIWGWSINQVDWSLLNIFSTFSYWSFIAGIVLMIIGVVSRPKELKEPFKKIAERFEEINKPLLMASIFIVFSSLWLLSYGFIGLRYQHDSEILLNMPPINNTISQENITAIENFRRTIGHELNVTILILAYLEIFSGIICVAAAVEVLQKKHLGFIISALVFAVFISMLFEYYFKMLLNFWQPGAITVGGWSYSPYLYACLFLPAIVSIIAILLILWQYKEYK